MATEETGGACDEGGAGGHCGWLMEGERERGGDDGEAVDDVTTEIEMAKCKRLDWMRSGYGV